MPLLDKLVRDRVVTLGHTLELCVSFRNIFDKKDGSRKVLFQEKRQFSINDCCTRGVKGVEGECPISLEVCPFPPRGADSLLGGGHLEGSLVSVTMARLYYSYHSF